MSSRVFSAQAMTAANLCKDMDYTGAKLATKHSIIHAPFSVWPGCLYKAAIRAAVFFLFVFVLFLNHRGSDSDFWNKKNTFLEIVVHLTDLKQKGGRGHLVN